MYLRILTYFILVNYIGGKVNITENRKDEVDKLGELDQEFLRVCEGGIFEFMIWFNLFSYKEVNKKHNT